MEHKANVDAVEYYGRTSLHMACYYDRQEIAAVRTDLSEKLSRDSHAVTQALIRYGADVNRADNDGWTPLHSASFNGRLIIAKVRGPVLVLEK